MYNEFLKLYMTTVSLTKPFQQKITLFPYIYIVVFATVVLLIECAMCMVKYFLMKIKLRNYITHAQSFVSGCAKRRNLF